MPVMTSSAPNLETLVQVRRAGVRSIHVERDLAVGAVSEGYVLTPQGQSVLARLLEHFRSETPSRAWTLTGPYGSGKSYFGLFVMNLLCRSLSTHSQSVSQLEAVEPLFADQARILAGPPEGQGWLPVPITGHRTSLQHAPAVDLNERFNRIYTI